MTTHTSPRPTGATASSSLDSSTDATPALPEPGQVVQVRGATWAVTDVREQGLPHSPADDSRTDLEHLVSLQSLAEDRMGEELTVIWELEVGNSIIPDRGLPETISADSFDDPDTLGAFVDAVRWGAVTSADAKAYQAPFRSGATLEPYQLEPLRRALEAPRTNLLLADDVGLGKTIEAGLVVEELLLRHRARSVIIVCPPSLALKWRDEMREKFGLEFVIVDSARIAADRRTYGLAANPLRLYPRVIVSMAWLPGVRAQRLLREVLDDAGRPGSARNYAFDVLVVDEAHHVAPAAPSAVGGGVDSQRTRALRRLAEKCEHRLFLSATPHNGYTESFTALLEMIDPRRFARGAEIDRRALAEVTVRRLKADVPDRDFKRRKVNSVEYAAAADEEEAYAKLDSLLRASGRQQGRRSLDIAALLLKKRFLSSPWAFARTLGNYLTDPVAAGADYYDVDDYYAEVMGSGQSDEEEGRLEQPETDTLLATRSGDALSAATKAELENLADWAGGYQARANSRLEALVSMLDAVCRPDGRHWTNERVVVFTEYADTLDWIVGVLGSQGYGADRLAVIQGSTPAEERERIRARFNDDPTQEPVRVLVATDAAGEGIDLQAYCHRLVNFDVPFNPSRLEQRIGRIDRYGQHHTPEVTYLIPRRGGGASQGLCSGELDFLNRLAEKITTETQDLGALNPLIDDVDGQITARLLGREQRGRRTQTADQRAVNQTLAGSRELNRSLTDLARGYENRKAQMHLTPQAGRRVVDTALRLANQPGLEPVGPLEEAGGLEELDAVPEGLAAFRVPALDRSWDEAVAGLAPLLHPDRPRPVSFDERSASLPGIVHVHLGHPLMRKATRTLRARLFSPQSEINRVTAVVMPGLEETYAASVSRLVLVGRGGLRLHEQVFVTGVRLRGSTVAEEKLNAVLDRMLDPGELRAASAAVREHLARAWRADGAHLRTRIEEERGRRARRLQHAVDDQLRERQRADAERVHGIYAAFRTNLTESLERMHAAEQANQDMLAAWLDDQRRQRERDMHAMAERLAALDDEERREADAVARRYEDVQPFIASVGLVFAVSEQDADQWEEHR
ncbi:DISARM system SNF2-like helicase DrmD [Actinomyces procaprae]|uniref:DISARM system SNF2-like helicase DrmD n=1 Tax=Actinomyces procaprae TaxID=2560010 RepID=UPI0010A25698|nr:DISARM system SNF2-like helicase DrmD [Actinomyces procaprae]